MHMLVSMYYCIYMFSYGPYGPEIKHYYYYYYLRDSNLHRFTAIQIGLRLRKTYDGIETP